jgi:hypothetical protein
MSTFGTGARGIVVAFAVLLAGSAGSSGCTDPNGVGGCEVLYVSAANDPSPETGLRVINDLDSGLDVIVGGDDVFTAGAEMYPGDCGIWGLPAGRYDVELRPCSQDGGSSECQDYLGEAVVRTVTVTSGVLTELRVTDALFR